MSEAAKRLIPIGVSGGVGVIINIIDKVLTGSEAGTGSSQSFTDRVGRSSNELRKYLDNQGY